MVKHNIVPALLCTHYCRACNNRQMFLWQLIASCLIIFFAYEMIPDKFDLKSTILTEYCCYTLPPMFSKVV